MLLCTSLQSGCTIWQSTRRTLRQEPHEFSWEHDRGASKTLYLSWADTAWQEARGYCTPENQSSYDYEWGFHEGFAEYCYAGGNGEPPGAPPRPYWHAFKRMSPERNKVDQWYSGYRHGAKVARTGGYRDQAILRSPLVNCNCALPAAAATTTFTEATPVLSAPLVQPAIVAPEVIAPPAKQFRAINQASAGHHGARSGRERAAEVGLHRRAARQSPTDGGAANFGAADQNHSAAGTGADQRSVDRADRNQARHSTGAITDGLPTGTCHRAFS